MSKIYYELFYNEVSENNFNKFYEVCKTLDWAKCKDPANQPRQPNVELGNLLLDYIYKNHKKIKFFSVDCASYNDSFFLNSVAVQMLPHSMVKIIIGNNFPYGLHEEHYKLSESSKIIKAIEYNIGDDLRDKIWSDEPPLRKDQAVLIGQEYDKFQASGLIEYGFTFSAYRNQADELYVAIQNPYIELKIPPALYKEEYATYCAKELHYALQFD
jgi:hypothetical protein|nr:MAG TPA: hypothetical protein [Caudoviricetes sp.]